MKNKFLNAFVIALILFQSVVPITALADDIVADGDILSTGNQTTINLGTVSAGAEISQQVSFTLVCSTKQHVDQGQVVNLAASAITVPAGGSLSATDAALLPVPVAWPDDTSGGGTTNCPSPAPAPINDTGNSLVSIIAPSTAGTYSFVVRYTFSLSPAGSGDNQAIQGAAHVDVTYSLTVPAPAIQDQTINVTNAAPASAAYASSFTVAATGGGSGNPVVIASSGACSGGGDNSALISMTSGTGTCTITYNQAGASGYNAAAEVTNTTSAQKAATTTTVTGGTFPYDGNAHPGTVTITGAGGLNLTDSPVYSGACSAAPVNVAETPCTASYTYAGDDNYTGSSGSATINISQASSVTTVTFETGPYTYRGSAFTATAVVTGAGLNQSVPVVQTGDCTNVTTPNGCTATAIFGGDANHTGSSDSKTITIGKADAVCTINGFSGSYDGLPHGATGTCVGADGEDLSAGLNLGGTFTDYPGGTVHWTFSGGSNYNDQAGNVDIEITKADASCTVNGYTGAYDGASHGATGSCAGAGGVDLSASLNLGDSFINYPGGTAHWTFNGGTNYSDESGDVAIVINKAVAVCSVIGYSDIYDAAAHGASGSCTGVGGTELAGLNLGDTFTNVPGGTAHWTFTGGTNYDDQSGDVAITITKADATCAINAYSGIYDADSHGASGSCAGIGGENAGSLDLGASFINVPGGTAHWVFTGNGNYKDQAGDVSIVIAKADAVCSMEGYSGVYDATPHGASGSCSGIGDESAGTLDLGATFQNVPGGTAHWIFTGNGNYNDRAGDVDIVLTPANADCSSIAGYSGVYDAAFHGASGSCTGVGSDGILSGLSLGATFKNVPGGTAHWTFTNGNYNPQSGDASIAITPADAACEVNGYNDVYDAAFHGASGSCTGVGSDGTLSGLDLGESFKDVPGGIAHWTFEGGTNYNDQSGTASIVITKADATCTISGYSGVYDAAAHGASGSCTGVGGDGTLSGLNLGGTFTDYPGGTAHWMFTGGTNYNNQSGDAAIDISKANATIHVVGYTGTYDAVAHGASGTATGVGGVDLSAGLSFGSSFTNVPGGTAHWTFAGGTNYNNAAGDVAIVINKADATCTVTGYNVVFDNNDHTATGSCKGILNETLTGLDLTQTTHKFPGTWSDPWTFTDVTGNYNNTSGTVADKIGAWTSNGFFQPVDMNNVLNTIRAGQTVPLKFELFSGTTELTSISAVNPLAYAEVSCTALANSMTDDIETTVTGGTALRYDTTAGQYIYNWKTPSTAGKCYRVTMTAQDGVTKIMAYFKTK